MHARLGIEVCVSPADLHHAILAQHFCVNDHHVSSCLAEGQGQHAAQVDEVSSHARNAEVDLNKLFTGLTFDEGEELALSAGQPLSKASPWTGICISVCHNAAEYADHYATAGVTYRAGFKTASVLPCLHIEPSCVKHM